MGTIAIDYRRVSEFGNIPIAPTMRIGLRPTLSTYRTAGMVANHMTMPTTPLANSEVVVPDRPKPLKICGA
jgi:hypothetical protein